MVKSERLKGLNFNVLISILWFINTPLELKMGMNMLKQMVLMRVKSSKIYIQNYKKTLNCPTFDFLNQQIRKNDNLEVS